MPHWGDAYYGALYLESVEDLLTPALSALEADAIAALLSLSAGARVLDLACGHGRHARALAARGVRVVGVDRAQGYLRRAAADAVATTISTSSTTATATTTSTAPASTTTRAALPTTAARGVRGATPITGATRTPAEAAPTPSAAPAYVRGDVRALPFSDGAFDALYSWYASLFMFDDPTNEACLAEAARVVRPGGRLVVHHANPIGLAREPEATARRALSDGSVVEERSSFDAARGVDRSTRRLVRRGGAVLAATAELRYYMPSEWRRLATRLRLRLLALTSTPEAARGPHREPGPEAPDLIALLEKPT